MIGVPGTAHRLFGALRDAGISVILISQGSSEHSICFAIPQAQAERAEEACAARSTRNCATARSSSVDVDRAPQHPRRRRRRHGRRARRGGARCSIRSARAAINVRAIAQGASERNISVVVDGKFAARALRAVHAGLLPVAQHAVDRPDRPGHGRPGAARADRAPDRAAARAQRRPSRARHRDSKRMLLDERRSISARWQERLQAERRAAGPREIRAARSGRLHSALGDHRLHGQRRGRRPITAAGSRAASTW